MAFLRKFGTEFWDILENFEITHISFFYLKCRSNRENNCGKQLKAHVIENNVDYISIKTSGKMNLSYNLKKIFQNLNKTEKERMGYCSIEAVKSGLQ